MTAVRFHRTLLLGLSMLCVVQALAAQNPAPAAGVSAGGEGGYGNALSTIYLAHQRVLAIREACDRLQPAQAKATEKAFLAWQGRNRLLLSELELRLTQMIRGVSKDEKDYLRNIGKYEGSIVDYRISVRDDLLSGPQQESAQVCADFRGYLAGAGADLQKEYAEELRLLRQRKLPK